MAERTIILPPEPSGNGGESNYRLTFMVPKRRYFSYLRERWWVVLITLSLALAGMFSYETFRPEQFTSFAELYASGEVHLNVANIFDEESLTYYGTQIELLKSPKLGAAAYVRMAYTPPVGQKSGITVDVVQPMKTSILRIRATGWNPDITHQYLQALIDEYLDYKKTTRRTTADDLVKSLTDQLSNSETNLQAEQDKWTGFQRSNNVAVLEEDAKYAGSYLGQLNLELAKNRLDRDLLAAGLTPMAYHATPTAGQLATSTNQTSLIASNTPAEGAMGDSDNPELSGSDTMLKSVMVQLAVKRAEMAKTSSEAEARAHGLVGDIERLEQEETVLEHQSLEDRMTRLDRLNNRIAAISNSIPALEARLLSIYERLAENQRLENNVQRERQICDHLATTLENADLGNSVQQERLSVFQAPTPAMPVDRHPVLRTVISGLLGILLGMALVFGWYLVDDRFVSVRDVQDQFGEMVLGLVPQIKVRKSKPESALLGARDDRTAYVESYRHLRSALLLSSVGKSRPHTLLFTGASSAEGKTTIAVNVARVLARSGLRVALLDADPHGVGIHRLLGAEGGPGVLDYLRGEVDAKSVVRESDIPGLSWVPAGTHTEHAEGLFLRPGLADLMAELKADRDYVILDGAPILAADDATSLVPHADTVLLVVRPFFSRARIVRQALEMLYQRQAKQVAIILNQARADDLAGHYARNGVSRNGQNGTSQIPKQKAVGS